MYLRMYVMYMKQPECLVTKGREQLVSRLKCSIYGLKKSSRCWNSVPDKRFKKIGFVQTDSDLCIYDATEGEMFRIAVHVEDTVLLGVTSGWQKSEVLLRGTKSRTGESSTNSWVSRWFRTHKLMKVDQSRSLCPKSPAEIRNGECQPNPHTSRCQLETWGQWECWPSPVSIGGW